MADGIELRAAIDTETVKALQLVNGGAAAGLMTMLPTILGKPGFEDLAYGSMGGITCGSIGLALSIFHNRLRRKCSLQHEARDAALKDSKPNPYPPCRRKWIREFQSGPAEPCICTGSVIAMWLSLVAFMLTVGCVAYGAWSSLPMIVAAATPPAKNVERDVQPSKVQRALVPVKIDHADHGSSATSGYICVFNFDVGSQRYRAEVNAVERAGCPQVIWVGGRP